MASWGHCNKLPQMGASNSRTLFSQSRGGWKSVTSFNGLKPGCCGVGFDRGSRGASFLPPLVPGGPRVRWVWASLPPALTLPLCLSCEDARGPLGGSRLKSPHRTLSTMTSLPCQVIATGSGDEDVDIFLGPPFNSPHKGKQKMKTQNIEILGCNYSRK